MAAKSGAGNARRLVEFGGTDGWCRLGGRVVAVAVAFFLCLGEIGRRK